MYFLLIFLNSIFAISQEIKKEYIKIRKDTFLKTDYNLSVGELYRTNDDYPFEIIETHHGQRENSYKIRINDEEFWVSETWCEHLTNDQVVTMQINWKKKIENEKEKELKEKEERERLIAEEIAEESKIKKEEEDKIAEEKSKRLQYLRKKYGKKAEDILNGYYWIGMSRNALIDSLGEPDSINKSVGKWGIHQQFVYGDYLYIYVENEIVTSYQKNE